MNVPGLMVPDTVVANGLQTFQLVMRDYAGVPLSFGETAYADVDIFLTQRAMNAGESPYLTAAVGFTRPMPTPGDGVLQCTLEDPVIRLSTQRLYSYRAKIYVDEDTDVPYFVQQGYIFPGDQGLFFARPVAGGSIVTQAGETQVTGEDQPMDTAGGHQTALDLSGAQQVTGDGDAIVTGADEPIQNA